MRFREGTPHLKKRPPGSFCVISRGGVDKVCLSFSAGPGSLHPFQLALAPSDTLAARPASGGSCAGCSRGPYRAYRGGGGGVGRPPWNPRSPAGSRALRRWRSADPAAAVLRVGLRRILSAALAGSGSLRHSCGPASLRRQLRCVSARWTGKGRPYRAYRGGGGGAGRPPWNPLSPAGSRALRWWRSADPAGAAGVGLRRCDLNGAPIVSCKMAA